jgi:tRNA nucleotidyltransferase (CCA-adding enzyme)
MPDEDPEEEDVQRRVIDMSETIKKSIYDILSPWMSQVKVRASGSTSKKKWVTIPTDSDVDVDILFALHDNKWRVFAVTPNPIVKDQPQTVDIGVSYYGDD